MSSNASTMNYPANDSMARLIALENRTGYTMQQFNGQRKYWNPKYKDPIPPRGCEVFVGKIPRDLFEDELVGQLYELRLMMDFSGFNRGYAFVCYTCREHAQQCIEKLDNYEIRPGQRIGVCRSVDNCRLFVGGIPKDKTQQEIMQAMCEISEDVSDVIVYPGIESGEANRGFAFVEYHTHRAAAMARRKLIPGRITIFGNEVVTDWAEPEVDANDTLSRIKNVYVRNLKVTTSHHTIFSAFNAIRPGVIERVKKIEDRDYAFVHFMRREDALYAVQVMNGQIIDGQAVQVSLAKPPSNKRDVKTVTITSAVSPPASLPNNGFTLDTKQQPYCFDRMNAMLISKPNTNTQPPNSMPSGPGLPVPNLLPVTAPQNQLANMMTLPNHNGNPPSLNMNQHQQQQQNPFSNNLPPVPNPFLNPLKLGHPSLSMSMPNLNYQVPPVPPSKPPTLGLSDSNMMNEFKRMLMTEDQNGKSNLEPVCTLDHISKIQCPVLYLDQLCSMFNNDIRPTYQLYHDESLGITRYVYKVTVMNKVYMPPSHMYSISVADARKNSARHVLHQLGPWLKLKFLEIVNGNRAPPQPPKPKEIKSPWPESLNSYPLAPMNWKPNPPTNLSAGLGPMSDTKPTVSINSDHAWKHWVEMGLPITTTSQTQPHGNIVTQHPSYSSLKVNSPRTNSSLGLSDNLWKRLPISEDSSPMMPSIRTKLQDNASLLAPGIGSSCFSDIKRQQSVFDQAAPSPNF